jgi:hypothetical protein
VVADREITVDLTQAVRVAVPQVQMLLISVTEPVRAALNRVQALVVWAAVEQVVQVRAATVVMVLVLLKTLTQEELDLVQVVPAHWTAVMLDLVVAVVATMVAVAVVVTLPARVAVVAPATITQRM